MKIGRLKIDPNGNVLEVENIECDPSELKDIMEIVQQAFANVRNLNEKN